jgi:single-stranded-DNA-specific exonuclease
MTTKRLGLQSLFKLAALDNSKIGVYEIGHVIAPRLNAMGRIEHAMDSLRLVCTKDKKRADDLAIKLNSTNTQRQQLTLESFLHAKGNISDKTIKKILFLSHESYEPGVIGLIAGKLTEEFYRPSIVLSVGEKYSKASARSVAGLNIIDFIRKTTDLLVDAGGHPMAAGFTVETKNIAKLKELIEKLAEENLEDDLLVKTLKIDCELPMENIGMGLFIEMNKLSPFGYGNPEPVFLDKEVTIENMNAIMFNYDVSNGIKVGDRVDVVYTITLNEWNGNKKLELKIKDLKKID